MLVGVMADSHDRVPAVAEFLRQMRERGAAMVLHAGDYVSPLIFQPFDDLHMALAGVFGQNDGDPQGLLARAASGLGLEIFQAPHSLEVSGKQILLVHDLGDVSKRSVAGHAVIIHGFTHKQSLKEEGDSLLINPGEACGWLHGTPGAALLDLDTLKAEFLSLTDAKWKY